MKTASDEYGTNGKKAEKGIALIIVLWVMMILMTAVLSLSLMIRAEMQGTLTYKDQMEKQFIAEAGVERGITEMIYRRVNAGQSAIMEGREAWKTDGTLYSDQLEQGTYTLRICDESGKISLNGLNDASSPILKNLLVNLGTSPTDADKIVDSILDWKDADDLHRLNGVEKDYYLALPHPYEPRNADFESLEELLLVRGITPLVLFGNSSRKGLFNFITLFNGTNRINLNAAPREILAALPGMDAALADQVIEVRDASTIENPQQILDKLGSAASLVLPYVGGQTGKTMTCTIEATGYTASNQEGYPVKATVMLEDVSNYRLLHYENPSESYQ